MNINVEKMVIKVTEKVLDDLLYKGKTLREWIDLIIKFEKDKNKILRHCWECKNRQTYKCTICKNNSQFEEMEEVEKQVEKSCNNCANYNSCDPSKCFNLIKGTRLNWKSKEVFGYDEYKDIRETLVGLTVKGYTSEMIKTVLEQMQGTVKQKTKDTRFICNTCKHKYRCERYGQVKEFIESNQNNDMKCAFCIKE